MTDLYVYRIYDSFRNEFVKGTTGKRVWTTKSGASNSIQWIFEVYPSYQYPPDRLEIRKFKLIEVT